MTKQQKEELRNLSFIIQASSFSGETPILNDRKFTIPKWEEIYRQAVILLMSNTSLWNIRKKATLLTSNCIIRTFRHVSSEDKIALYGALIYTRDSFLWKTQATLSSSENYNSAQCKVLIEVNGKEFPLQLTDYVDNYVKISE